MRIPFANMANDIAAIDYFAITGNSKNKGDRDIYFDHFRLTTITGPDQSAPGAPTDLTAKALRAIPPNVGGEKGVSALALLLVVSALALLLVVSALALLLVVSALALLLVVSALALLLVVSALALLLVVSALDVLLPTSTYEHV